MVYTDTVRLLCTKEMKYFQQEAALPITPAGKRPTQESQKGWKI